MREQVIQAFKELRKLGLIARANHWCCGSCASASIGGDYDKMNPKKKAKIKGGVYWHHQDEQSLQKGYDLYLGFGSLGVEGDDKEQTEAVGRLIVEVLTKYGLRVEWDGSHYTRIKVLNPRYDYKRKPKEENTLIGLS